MSNRKIKQIMEPQSSRAHLVNLLSRSTVNKRSLAIGRLYEIRISVKMRILSATFLFIIFLTSVGLHTASNTGNFYNQTRSSKRLTRSYHHGNSLIDFSDGNDLIDARLSLQGQKNAGITLSQLKAPTIASQQQQKQQLQQQTEQSPAKLVFSNSTGAIVKCSVVGDLIRAIGAADELQRSSSRPPPSQLLGNLIGSSSGGSGGGGGGETSGINSAKQHRFGGIQDIQVKWEKENGEEVEQNTYAQEQLFAGSNSNNNNPIPFSDLETATLSHLTSSSQTASGSSLKSSLVPQNTNVQSTSSRPLRFVRPSDGALVFEPFRAHDFRPDVHASTYRCTATSESRHASLTGTDIQVRAVVAASAGFREGSVVPGGGQTGASAGGGGIQIEVLDELVMEGNSARFKCQLPSYTHDYLHVIEWVEYPSETSLTVQSTTKLNADHLFKPNANLRYNSVSSLNLNLNQQTNNTSMIIESRYFVAPKTGDLHIVNVDSSFNYRTYKCRCRNQLTGELLSSVNRGKLIVTDPHTPVAPRLLSTSSSASLSYSLPNPATMMMIMMTQHQNQNQNLYQHAANNLQLKGSTYEEGELALLSCNMQSHPRAQFTWFKRLDVGGDSGSRRGSDGGGSGGTGTGNGLESQEQQQLLAVATSGNLVQINSNLAGGSATITDAAAATTMMSSLLNGEQMETRAMNKYVQVANLLLINRLNRNDSGSYVCLAKNSAGEERQEIELLVRARLRVKLSASAQVLELGKSLALDCSVSGSPISQLIFKHNQKIIKSLVVGEGSLLSNSMDTRHVGASSSSLLSSSTSTIIGGATANRNYNFNFNRNQNQNRADGLDGYFVVSGAEDNQDETDDDDQVVKSMAGQVGGGGDGGTGGSGQPTIGHKQQQQQKDDTGASDMASSNNDNRNNGDPTTTTTTRAQNKLSHVIVIVLEPQHEGAYQCIASNQFESVQSSTYIRVIDDPPKFRDTFKAEVFEQRADISLQCSASANPLPEITWSVDEQPIPESSSRMRFGDFVSRDNLVVSYVNISQAQVQDSGLYRCTADNGLAQVSHQAQISVAGPVQVKTMLNTTVVASTSFKIRCPVAGYPIGEIQWQHNGRRLPANHRQHVYENGTLLVEHMEKSQQDDGEYICLASQQAGQSPSAAGSLHLAIKARPTIEPFSISRSLREGQRASITCTMSSGDLPISISWLRNGRPLVSSQDAAGNELVLQTSGGQSNQQPSQAQLLTSGSSSSSNNQLDQTSATTNTNSANNQTPQIIPGVRISRLSDYASTLLFESLLAQHSGNYTCMARNEAGTVSHEAPMVVQVAPRWSIEPSDTKIIRGTSMSIDCMAAGFPPPRIIWTKAAGEPQSTNMALSINSATNAVKTGNHHLGSWRPIVSSPHLQVYENGSLNVLDARDSDAGHYMCQALNGVGPGLSKVVRVIINVAAQFNARHSIQYVVKGEQTQLKCQAKGDWPLAVHWYKNRHRLEPFNTQDSPVGVSSSSSSSSTSGSTTINSQLPATLSSSVASVMMSPAIGSQHSTMQLMEQLNDLLAQMPSFASAMPNGSHRLQSQSNQNSGAGLLMAKYSLSTTELAINRLLDNSDNHGQQHAATTTTRSDGGDRTQSLQFQQPLVVQVNSMLTIGQAERHDTATFRCISANKFGSDERIIQLIVQEAPDKIDNLMVHEVNSRSITISWLAPYDGNSPITHYHVQYREAGGNGGVGGANSISTGGLGNGSSGSLSSDLLNGLGWFNYTLASSTLAATTATTTPTQGSSGGSSQMSNSASQSSFASSSSSSLSSSSSSAASLVLAPKSMVNVQANGNNDNGHLLSPASPASISTLTTSGTGVTSIGGRALVKLTINSLRPVTRYWFRVEAENKLGRGQVSALVESLTLDEAPGGAPSKLKAVAQSSSTILVSWSRLSDKELFGRVDGYYLAYKPLLPTGGELDKIATNATGENRDRGQQQQQQQQQQTVLQTYKTIEHDDKLGKFDALLTGLKRSTKYMISVQAFNVRGAGPSSDPIVVKTLDMDPPKQVKLYVKQSSNCTIQLEWRPLSQLALERQAQSLANSMDSTASGGGNRVAQPLALPMSSLWATDKDHAPRQQEQRNQQQQQPVDSIGDRSINGQADIVDYYSLFKAELTDRPQFEEIKLPGHAHQHTVEGLRCGTRYQFYMMGVNKIGVGDQSDILDTRTIGGLPLAPDRQSTFDVTNATCYTIRLDHWQDNGCPIRAFNIRFKPEGREWTQLAHFDLLSPIESERQSSQATTQQLPSSSLSPQQSAKSLAVVSTQAASPQTSFWPQRTRRSASSNDVESQEDFYVLSNLDSSSISGGGGGVIDANADVAAAYDEGDSFFSSNDYGGPISNGDAREAGAELGPESNHNLLSQQSSSFVDLEPANSNLADDYDLDQSLATISSTNLGGSRNSSVELIEMKEESQQLVQQQQQKQLQRHQFQSLQHHHNQPQQQQRAKSDNRLFSLLKDSMVPTFDSESLEAPMTMKLSGDGIGGGGGGGEAKAQSQIKFQLPPVAQAWEESNFIIDKSHNFESPTRTAAQQQQSGPRLDNKQLDWRRVRFCNLIENIYYSVQITATNSVGETEAELKLITSEEGLEYDQEIKRQVVGRLGENRLAQSIALGTDRLLAWSQWPILLPITLTIILMTIIIIATLLLKRNNSSGSTATTTTTTTTTMGSSSSHCQSYLDESHAGHHHHLNHLQNGLLYKTTSVGGAPSAITEPATLGSSIDGSNSMMTPHGHHHSNSNNNSNNNNNNRHHQQIEGNYAVAGPRDAFGNMSIYQQNVIASDQSVMGSNSEEPAYGVVGLAQLFNHRSSGSPATTIGPGGAATSSGGSSSNSGPQQRHSCTMPRQMHQSEANVRAAQRNVYLCSQDDANNHMSIGQQQQQQHQQHEAIDPNMFYGMSQTLSHNRHNNQLAQGVVYGDNQFERHQQQQTNDPAKLDFLAIVEEVAKANENLRQTNGLSMQQESKLMESPPDNNTVNYNNFESHAGQIQLTDQPFAVNQANFTQTVRALVDESMSSRPIGETSGQDPQVMAAAAGQLMFDPVYATIRRTFPQAFRYLTLQHQQSQQQLIQNQVQSTSQPQAAQNGQQSSAQIDYNNNYIDDDSILR